MDKSSTRNDRGEKGILVTELVRNDQILCNGDNTLSPSAQEHDRPLREVKMQEDSSFRSQDSLSDSFECMLTDYITTLTIATVFLFSYNPWAALFWPPYYYYHHNNARGQSHK